jgi:hypothetical protein
VGSVPEAYFEFVMHYASFFYVVPTSMVTDATGGQKEVTVADGSKFQAGFPVQIKDSAHSEWNQVQSVAGNVLTLESNLINDYFVSKGGLVEGPDSAFGRGAFAAAFGLEFLCEAYSAPQFASVQAEVLVKIIDFADWLVSQQCMDPARAAYCGFRSSESSNEYWSIDASRAIVALLKAYSLTSDVSYLDSAKLAGSVFLYNMQHQPAVLGINDRYYGGFAQYVDIGDGWGPNMAVEDLYGLIGLKMLAETYDVANASRYSAMMGDLAGFLREGLEGFWLYFYTLPSGDGVWHRIGLTNTEVYDDPLSFALLGLYFYEGWSSSCQRVYSFLQFGIKASGQYPGYMPDICWAGYIDVVSRSPTCSYYDGVTIGILSEIRKEQDPPSYKLAHQIATKYSTEFLNWGPLFTDYSPITPAKAMANVSWIGRMFLNYEEPQTQFTKILNSKGETVLLYPVRQAKDTTTYGEPLDVLGVISALKAEQVLIEAGYYLEDYLALYTFIPTRVHDKIRRQGQDYEIQTMTPYIYKNQRLYFKSTIRKLQSN